MVPVGAAQAINDDLKNQEPAGEAPHKIIDSPGLFTVKLRDKETYGEVSTGLSRWLIDQGLTMAQSTDDFRFAASVALRGMLLRDSQFAGEATFEMVERLGLDGLGKDPQGERATFLDLVGRWCKNL